MSAEHGGHGGGGSIEVAHPPSVIESILGILTFAFIINAAVHGTTHPDAGGGHGGH